MWPVTIDGNLDRALSSLWLTCMLKIKMPSDDMDVHFLKFSKSLLVTVTWSEGKSPSESSFFVDDLCCSDVSYHSLSQDFTHPHKQTIPRTKGWRRANARNVSFSISVRWSIYIINSVDKPNFRVSLPHRRSTTVSLETNPLYSYQGVSIPKSISLST